MMMTMVSDGLGSLTTGSGLHGNNWCMPASSVSLYCLKIIKNSFSWKYFYVSVCWFWLHWTCNIHILVYKKGKIIKLLRQPPVYQMVTDTLMVTKDASPVVWICYSFSNTTQTSKYIESLVQYIIFSRRISGYISKLNGYSLTTLCEHPDSPLNRLKTWQWEKKILFFFHIMKNFLTKP